MGRLQTSYVLFILLLIPNALYANSVANQALEYCKEIMDSNHVQNSNPDISRRICEDVERTAKTAKYEQLLSMVKKNLSVYLEHVLQSMGMDDVCNQNGRQVGAKQKMSEATGPFARMKSHLGDFACGAQAAQNALLGQHGNTDAAKAAELLRQTQNRIPSQAIQYKKK